MNAALIDRPGHPPAYAEFRAPDAGPGEVRISVTAAALSPLTRARASGAHYSADRQLPFVAGVDGVGRLDDGRRVCFMLPRAPFGAMAEQTVVAAAQCVAVPNDLDDATAAAIANPGMSSWAALTERARIVPGETVLINGATGAAGRLAVRIARHLGAARVIATGRNVAVLAALGADTTIALGQADDMLAQAFAQEFGSGVDIVLDYLWGPTARALLAAAAERGRAGVPIRFVQIGSAGGGEIAMSAAVLRSSAIALSGSGLGSVSTAGLMAAIGEVMKAATPAGLSCAHRLVPLSAVAAAWPADDAGLRTVFTIGDAIRQAAG